jgi:hypothetical protein
MKKSMLSLILASFSITLSMDTLLHESDFFIIENNKPTPQVMHTHSAKPHTTNTKYRIINHDKEDENDPSCAQLGFECTKCCCKCLLVNLGINRIMPSTRNHKTDKNK